MKIGGLQKLSLVDYPHHTAVAMFTIGCNMRCGYCHNPELVLPERYADTIPEEDILLFLESRMGLVEGVVISGGEPTMHADLPRFIKSIKKLGFLVKLDTNGTNPDMIGDLFREKMLDYVAMDIKASMARYQEVVARPVDTDAIKETIQLIKASGVDHEFRTTLVKSQVSPEDLNEIGRLIQGSPRFALQRFRPGLTLNPQFARETTYSDEELAMLKVQMERYVKECVVH
ncbi:MAG: anaerobic ribonucleoside-triphosphate reductase activating protein [Candidatus Saccharimonadaceae bacterium]